MISWPEGVRSCRDATGIGAERVTRQALDFGGAGMSTTGTDTGDQGDAGGLSTASGLSAV